MASRWMQPKLDKQKKQAGVDAAARRDLGFHSLETINRLRDGKRELVTLAGDSALMARRGAVSTAYGAGIGIGKNKRRVDRSTGGDFAKRRNVQIAASCQVYETELLVLVPVV
jgi:hypothetical protein